MAAADFAFQGQEFKPTDPLPYIQSPQGEKAIELRNLDIHVVVTGLYAETTQTMTFYNPNSRDLEGELCFPLPDNAAVCGYALDVEGRMVDGVIVPKEEARRILETEIRKGVDPGLAEHVQGNMYRIRIYPVPAKGTRTIRLSYLSSLVVQNNDASYHLPLGHARGLEKAALKVEVVQSPVQPKISSNGNLTMNLWQDRWVAEATLDTTAVVDDLLVRLPGLQEQLINVEKNDNGTFFCISTALQPEENKKWQAERIGIAWDASGSRTAHSDLNREFALISNLFAGCGVKQADLLVFRNVAEPDIKSFDSADALIQYLEALAYDGGTDLSSLDFNRFDPDIAACFLFSDGMSSNGNGLTDHYPKPVVTVNSSSRCNADLLQFAASQSNGTYLDLRHKTVEQAGTAISRMTEKPQVTRATGCEDIFVENENGRMTIAGRLTGKSATISLTGLGASPETLEIADDQACSTGNISRAWAGYKIRQLALINERSDEIISLGRRFGLVTPGTSLLVLESLDQYLEYDITPPASLPQIRDAFLKQRNSQEIDKEERLKFQLDQVVKWWDERTAWWETDFQASWQRQRKILDEEGRQRQSEASAHHSSASIPRECDSVCFSGLAGGADFGSLHRSPPDFSLDDRDDFDGEAPECVESASHDRDRSVKEKSPAATMRIQAWDPNTPYLRAIQTAEDEQLYPEYLLQRKQYADSPSFFLDCGDYFFKQGQLKLAVRILSNLEELQLGDLALLRIYAWRLQQAGNLNQAIRVFERIRKIRDDEPQSHRDLALALADRWQQGNDAADAVQAMNLLYDVIIRSWDRFPEIELIALMELNRLIHFAGQAGIAPPERIDNRLIRPLDLDIRISMSWDADLTDVDLHVFEPDDGHAYYGHNRTLIGGLVSKDFTEGYGPEEYILHHAMPGTYSIRAHYYGSHQQKINGPCTVTATVFTNYGRDNEQKQVLTLRLDEASDRELVGEITIEGEPWGLEKKPLTIEENLVEKFKSLTTGMSIDEVKAQVGQPQDIRGDDEILLTYALTGNSKIELHFSPRLGSIRHIMDGCILDIL